MLFNSAPFVFLFLPVVLCGLFLFGRLGAHRLSVIWLIVASAVFYGWFKVSYLPLLAVLIVFNYYYGKKLSRDRRSGRARAVALAFGVGVNMAVLVYFKYTNFFIDNVNSAMHTHLLFDSIVLPLGISFFTFQKIAYLVDSYRGETKDYNPLDFTLFVYLLIPA